ncbi:hypothetical protein C5932_08310 [Cronobacter sakazakii]|nr:hypothetical protein C5934_11945 [Cronobacter sakazakii]PQX89133.1 hypothetical protein C5932_08310 [Cronobacter sakazakii]
MVATIYGSSQAQLSERLGNVMRCDARFTADIKKPRYCEARLLSIFLIVRICPLQASSESSNRMLSCTLSPKVMLLCISGITQSTRRFAGIGSVGAFTTSY